MGPYPLQNQLLSLQTALTLAKWSKNWQGLYRTPELMRTCTAWTSWLKAGSASAVAVHLDQQQGITSCHFRYQSISSQRLRLLAFLRMMTMKRFLVLPRQKQMALLLKIKTKTQLSLCWLNYPYHLEGQPPIAFMMIKWWSTLLKPFLKFLKVGALPKWKENQAKKSC